MSGASLKLTLKIRRHDQWPLFANFLLDSLSEDLLLAVSQPEGKFCGKPFSLSDVSVLWFHFLLHDVPATYLFVTIKARSQAPTQVQKPQC